MYPPENYIIAAIRGEAAVIANAQSSTRNHTLNRGAFMLGRVPGMNTDTATNALMLASRENGYIKEHGESAHGRSLRAAFGTDNAIFGRRLQLGQIYARRERTTVRSPQTPTNTSRKWQTQRCR